MAHLQARPLDLLVDGAHDLPPQHRTLRLAIQRSYALLKPDEQLLFRYLGVFAGGFDLAAAEAISNLQQPSDILLSLIGKSLVRAEALAEGTQRFSLLETIREFALEQLRAHDEVDILQHRHYAVYLQFFRTGDSHLRGAETTIWFARLSHDHDNLRAALQWTFNEKRYADAAWLLIAVYWFWHLQGNWYEKGRWLAQLIHHRQTLESDLRLAVLANVYSAARTWEEFLPLERYTVEMMQLLEMCSNKLLQAVAWFWLAFSSTDFAQAATAWEQAIESARSAAVAPKLGAEFCLLADYDFVLVTCLWDYAIALIERGQISQATPLVTECLEILQRRENRYEIADGIGTLGILALLQGNLEQAHRYFTEAVTLATAFNCQWMLGNWQPLLGIVTLYEGNVAEARQLLNDSWRLCVELKDRYCLSRV
ncbi:MAG: hypothetical protein KDE31_09660, partial [Caldilineaceae bacterium]|nr:hypothetical protein [Caldilineaceae bacterium]